MRRYYFDVLHDGHVVADEIGIELESVSAALHEAEGAAREMLADAIKNDRPPPTLVAVYDDLRQRLVKSSWHP